MTSYIHPLQNEIDAIRKGLTKLELDFDYKHHAEPRLTDMEVSSLLTSLAVSQENLERKICHEFSSATGTEINHL